MPRRTPRSVLERKIYFYRANAGFDGAGRLLSFDPTAAFKHVRRLRWTSEGRYLPSSDGRVTCCWIDRSLPVQRIRLGNVRRADFPLVERHGTLSPLDIPRAAGLVEVIHAVFFPKNIVGVDFNFHGPRLSRLGDYLLARGGDHCPAVSFEPLLRQDVAEQINRLEDIRLFRLKIRASYTQTIARANRDLGSAFEAAARAGEAEALEIVLSPRPYSRQRLSQRLMETARNLIRRGENNALARGDLHTEVSRFIIKGRSQDTGRIETLDLLSDQLILKKEIVRQDPRARALDSESAYAAIKQAHSELQQQLLVAASIQS